MTMPYNPSQALPFALQGPSADSGRSVAEGAKRQTSGTPDGLREKSVLQESAPGPFSRKRRRGPGLAFGKPTRRVKP